MKGMDNDKNKTLDPGVKHRDDVRVIGVFMVIVHDDVAQKSVHDVVEVNTHHLSPITYIH